MFNKVILLGHLSKNIELRYLASGSAVANTAIATNRKYKNKTGQKEKRFALSMLFFLREQQK